MTVFSFHAQGVVSEHPDGECYLAGFADKKDDTEIYLTLQRSYDDEEQDIQLGMNTFHIEWCGQENSGYGGITRFVLKPSSVEVYFEPKMAVLLGGMASLSITFGLDASEHEALKEALKRVFLGSNCLEFADALEPDSMGIETVARLIGEPIKYMAADGYELEIIAGAVHEAGHIAYVQCRAYENEGVADINFHIHLRVQGQANASWPIESYNPYFGCDVGLLTWLEDVALFIYREKHRTYACVFGPDRPATFKEIADDWVLADKVIGFWKWNEDRVSRLSLPSLTQLESLSEDQALEQSLLPSKWW